MIEILFALSFTIHNIEEAVWLPNWSNDAKEFHKPVKSNEFIFAVIIITIVGYLLTFLNFVLNYELIKSLYLGYVGMMVLNSLFPHLISTIVLKKYAPGLLTGLLLNAPIGLYLVIKATKTFSIFYIICFSILVSIIVIISIKYLFKIGRNVIK